MKILHIGHVPMSAGHPLGPRVSKYAYYPGRWVLSLAKAQTAHTSDQVEILIKVPSGDGHWTTEIKGVACHLVSVSDFLRGKTALFLGHWVIASRAVRRQPTANCIPIL